MTPDQTIELAKQAGGSDSGNGAVWLMTYTELERFTEMVRNATLDEAAKVCDEQSEMWTNYIEGSDACEDCAKEIRRLKA